MNLFSDERSISSNFEKKIASIDLTFDTDHDGLRKNYPNLSDRLYYSLGDSYIAARSFKTLKLFKSEVQPFLEIGFRRQGSSVTRTKTSLLRDREINYNTILGVEPNGLANLSTSSGTYSLYDPYTYPCTSSPFNDFLDHAADRWNMRLPKSLKSIIVDNIKLIKSEGLKRDSVIYKSLPVVEASFDEVTSGPFDVIESDGQLVGTGRVFGPVLSKALENPRAKNLYRSIGLIMVHTSFILIGESPGTHYLKYRKMRNNNTVFWDPRPADLPFTKIERLFGQDDIQNIVDRCNEALLEDEKVLLLIDIRRDKTGDAVEWEQMVHRDNELTCELINRLDERVTVCAKMRPAYGDYVMPKLTRKVRMLPLPYLKHTTSEFNMFVPSRQLMNGTERSDWTYKQLEDMGNEVFVLKSVIGALYNKYLCDLHLCLGVINRAGKMSVGTSALWSISNVSNDMDDFVEFLGHGKNFMAAFPYAKLGNDIVSRPSRNRMYEDYAITAYDEVMMPQNIYVIPLYAIPDTATVTQHDFRNCVITDDQSILVLSQPEGVISTQVVKLVSFMLKDVFSEAGLDWTKIDKEIRANSIRHFAKSVKSFDIQERTDGSFTVDGRLVTVSGHMLYIILGSILGLPYGIKKYIKEVEHNILHPGQSYERKVGGRVWHGLLSHYLSLNCVIEVIDSYMRMDVPMRKKLVTVINYVRDSLLDLGRKYEVYLHVDESDTI